MYAFRREKALYVLSSGDTVIDLLTHARLFCDLSNSHANEWSPFSQWKVIISVVVICLTVLFPDLVLYVLFSVRRSMLFIEE